MGTVSVVPFDKSAAGSTWELGFSVANCPMAVSPRGHLLAIAGGDSATLKLWDYQRGELLDTVEFPKELGETMSIAFASDGGTLYVGTSVGAILKLGIREHAGGKPPEPSRH
jgi:WD40 repeat protein